MTLETLETVHRQASQNVRISEPNQSFAIYILGGRAITLLYTAIALVNSVHLAELGAIVRLIDETIYLADFIYDQPSNSEHLQKWLNNEVIRPKKLRMWQSKLFERVFGRKDEIFDNSVSEHYNILSKYVHPTYDVSKMNMAENTLQFDYQWEDYQGHDITIFVSVSAALVSVMNMFIYQKDYYEITPEEIQAMSSLRDGLAELDI